MHGRKEQQQFFMQLAIRLGEEGRITAPPNPWVGCIVVGNGEMVGRGVHLVAGTPHAEQIALTQAGARAKGSTVYVTLEPCPHQGRTPPCTDALIKAGVSEVVIPFLDPDPRVNGQGVAALEKAGIRVIVGVCETEAKKSLEPYLFHRQHGRPFCVLKTAVSLDGRVALADGTSKWITGEEAREDVQQLRAESQAIMVGARTARIDQPRLTVRKFENCKPLRVVLDAKGTLPPIGPLFDTSLAPTLIFTTKQCPQERLGEWQSKGVDVAFGYELDEILTELGRRNVLQVLVEGGALLHAEFLKDHLAQKMIVYIAPRLLGMEAKSMLPLPSPISIEQASAFDLLSARALGNDVRLDFMPKGISENVV